MTLHDIITKTLTGSNMHKPVALETLRRAAASVCDDLQDLYDLLDKMHIDRAVMRASGFKEGKQNISYWINTPMFAPTPAPKPRVHHIQPAKQVQSNNSTPQETPMTNPTDIRAAISNEVAKQPGITLEEICAEVKKKLPGTTVALVNSNLYHLPAIKRIGRTNSAKFYPAAVAPKNVLPKGKAATHPKPNAPAKPVTAKRTSPDLESAIKAKQCAELLIEDMRALNKTNNVLVKEILSDLLHPAHTLHSKLTKIADHLTAQS